MKMKLVLVFSLLCFCESIFAIQSYSYDCKSNEANSNGTFKIKVAFDVSENLIQVTDLKAWEENINTSEISEFGDYVETTANFIENTNGININGIANPSDFKNKKELFLTLFLNTTNEKLQISGFFNYIFHKPDGNDFFTGYSVDVTCTPN